MFNPNLLFLPIYLQKNLEKLFLYANFNKAFKVLVFKLF